ncbi:helix-turn-helix domain-containing protein [Solirubrobacter ginsenosidimutans]|uniref:Helix-turn-helix domain-containing protein n=1 Tax=Solirubrobacter ginsenosidimutans TaxID=490573 RepID=A0A9X3SBN7_9ACTN|nr:helix-turn-helix domain-containing protein [Solirubrobacter ginsenosidimutans]MDA0167158.1 helix-turn-helix domain-containing protein [Solirubrobacter ginsenosidimutans]
MGAIADRFEADLDAIVAEADAVIIGAIPALGADPAIAAEVSASTRGNLRRLVNVARRAVDPPPADVAPEALDLARTLVRRGIESDVIYKGYRRGQQVAWQRWLACAEAVVGPGEELFSVLDASLRLLFDYVDQVLGRVIAEMQREREEILGGALARRTETVRLILDGAPLDSEAASRRLGYDLGRHHTAIVLWAEPPDVPQGALESGAVALARSVGARRPLTLSAGTTTLWAWIGTDAGVAPAAFRAALQETDLRAAIGPTLRGIVGFRRSHEAAISVQRLVSRNREGGQVATYDELEVTALAAHDDQRAAEFVVSTLGPLAEDNPAAGRLRETLRVFLDEAEHAPRSAARLHTHRNTVLQRVARATELLGYRPGEQRLAVMLALELRRRLGPGREA